MNAVDTRPVVTCARCHLRRQHAARGLCRSCYTHVAKHGGLDDYEQIRVDQTSTFCLCPTPVLARVALFQATYCDTCKRAIRGVTDQRENP